LTRPLSRASKQPHGHAAAQSMPPSSEKARSTGPKALARGGAAGQLDLSQVCSACARAERARACATVRRAAQSARTRARTGAGASSLALAGARSPPKAKPDWQSQTARAAPETPLLKRQQPKKASTGATVTKAAIFPEAVRCWRLGASRSGWCRASESQNQRIALAGVSQHAAESMRRRAMQKKGSRTKTRHDRRSALPTAESRVCDQRQPRACADIASQRRMRVAHDTARRSKRVPVPISCTKATGPPTRCTQHRLTS